MKQYIKEDRDVLIGITFIWTLFCAGLFMEVGAGAGAGWWFAGVALMWIR